MIQFEDTLYQVLPDGRILNFKGEEISQWVSNTGYKKVKLYGGSKKKDHYVHRLVAEVYVDNPDNLPQVMHKDNDKLNCSSTNLKWGTNSENTQAGYDDKLYQFKQRSHAIKAVNKTTGGELHFKSVRQADEVLGYNRKTITSILKGIKETNNFDHEFYYEMPND